MDKTESLPDSAFLAGGPTPGSDRDDAPPDPDELALLATFEMQPLNDAIISLGVAVTGAQSAARAVRPNDPVAEVGAAWACHNTLLRECARLVEGRAHVLMEAVQRLLQAR